MKRWILLSLIFVPLLASAASFWDGNAALQRGDASFESGLYAASNSFPAGTQIAIQNQDTGKTVTATVTGRIEGQSDILVLLSPKTAEALDLPQGTLGRVRVTVPPRAGSVVSAPPGDQTVSSDPDLNPAAAYGTYEKVQVADTQAPVAPATPAAPASTAAPQEPPTAAPAQPTPSEKTVPAAAAASPEAPPVPAPPTPAPMTAPEPPASTNADDAAIISAAQARAPQKQVFQPPREDEKFTYHPPTTVPPQVAATTSPAAAPQGAAAITGVEGEPTVTPTAQPPADLA